MAADAAHSPRLGALGSGADWLDRLRAAFKIGLVLLLVEILYIALASPRFAVREIELRGNEGITREVARTLRAPTTINLFRAPKRELAAQAEKVAAVKRARVTRSFPSRLVVALERREAMAVIRQAKRALLVDRDGTLFTIEDEWGWGLTELVTPHSTNEAAAEADLRAEAAKLLSVMEVLGPDPRLRIARLELEDGGAIEAVLESGARVRLGDGKELERKARLLSTLIDELGESRIEYLDLSDPDGAYWRERKQSASVGTR